MPKGWQLSLKQRNKRTHPIRAQESNRRCSSSFLGRGAGEGAEGKSLSIGRRRHVRVASSHALRSAAATPGCGSRRHRVLRRSWADARPRWGASLAALATAANCSPCYMARFARRASSDFQSPRSPVVHPKGNPEEGNRSRLRWRNGRSLGLGNLLGWDLPAWKGSGTKSGGAEDLSPECSQEP